MSFLGDLFKAVVSETLNPHRADGEKWDTEMSDYSLTCRRCKGLAKPIPDTENRYKCDSCGNQFAAAPHGMDTLANRKAIAKFRRTGKT